MASDTSTGLHFRTSVNNFTRYEALNSVFSLSLTLSTGDTMNFSTRNCEAPLTKQCYLTPVSPNGSPPAARVPGTTYFVTSNPSY